MTVALHRRLVTWLVTTSLAAYSARAQDVFVWGFTTLKGFDLPECSRVQIFLQATSAAQPPYTLFAYEANGIPTVQNVGSDISNLWWTVDHAAGSQLILSMEDGAGNPGGVSTNSYAVTPGTNTSCHAQNPTSPISITTNTTKTLNTCDVLPLKITGGREPYKLTIAALDWTSVTNVSMGVYDQYNWVNRAAPNMQLLAIVSDATGTYGAATAILSTAGTTDVTCDGRQSTLIDTSGKVSASQSGTSAMATSTSSQSNSSSTSGKTSMGTIIGGAVGGLILVAILLAGLLFFLRKSGSRPNGPHQYYNNGPPQGYGLGKVGGPTYPPVEESTPFVTSPPAAPYRDYDQTQYNQRPYSQAPYGQAPYSQRQSVQNDYNQATYSSGADTLVGSPSLPDQHGRLISTSQYSSGTGSPIPGATSPPMSAMTFNDPFANVPTGTSSGPSTYTASTTQRTTRGLSAVSEGTSDNLAGPVAGTSRSTGILAVANPGGEGAHSTDVKGGEPVSRESQVYQHEDVEDVVELPPAYRERPA